MSPEQPTHPNLQAGMTDPSEIYAGDMGCEFRHGLQGEGCIMFFQLLVRSSLLAAKRISSRKQNLGSFRVGGCSSGGFGGGGYKVRTPQNNHRMVVPSRSPCR
mmetsp:Transcript_48269/g.58230  ORF Transcript_48269/g.58230 Transcript_48269/m.58230 type:complete len:103 (-) Transcript_48269:272-580(-)